MNRIWILLVVALLPDPCCADELRIVAAKDSTLYESSTGALANGMGTFLYSGTTGQLNGGVRRALLSFDLSDIPATASVTGAVLSVTVTKAAGSGERQDFALHRVISDWGEGESDASTVGQGMGITALDGDATWIHTIKPNSTWVNEGGDFVELASDTISIGGEDRYTWGPGGGLIQDVQFWLDEPNDNFGWIIIGDESERRTAKQINSRTNEDALNRPLLSVTFDVPSVAADCDGNGVVDLADLNCSCSNEGTSIEDVRSALQLAPGDIDGDGSVAFADFLALANHFGQAAPYTEGDIDCDGEVAFADFLILSANFGKTATGSLANVPEPSCLAMLMIGLLFPRLAAIPFNAAKLSREGDAPAELIRA